MSTRALSCRCKILCILMRIICWTDSFIEDAGFVRRTPYGILIMLGVMIQHHHRSVRLISLIQPLYRYRISFIVYDALIWSIQHFHQCFRLFGLIVVLVWLMPRRGFFAFPFRQRSDRYLFPERLNWRCRSICWQEIMLNRYLITLFKFKNEPTLWKYGRVVIEEYTVTITRISFWCDIIRYFMPIPWINHLWFIFLFKQLVDADSNFYL
jgi:hypothetical protein